MRGKICKLMMEASENLNEFIVVNREVAYSTIDSHRISIIDMKRKLNNLQSTMQIPARKLAGEQLTSP